MLATMGSRDFTDVSVRRTDSWLPKPGEKGGLGLTLLEFPVRRADSGFPNPDAAVQTTEPLKKFQSAARILGFPNHQLTRGVASSHSRFQSAARILASQTQFDLGLGLVVGGGFSPPRGFLASQTPAG